MSSSIRRACLLLQLVACSALANEAPIVQPGPPGAPSKQLSADQALQIAQTAYSPADVRFMQDMIPHHHQAIVMAELAGERTNRSTILDAAGRINASQADEIAFMQTWLTDRGEQAPDPTQHHAMHTDHKMAGMASAEQMAALAKAEGTAFDRLFLELMITHHEGAVTMVEELLEQPGAAYDPVLFEFTNDITNDQTLEIERMHAVLITLSDDPRANLKAGFLDAEQAISNLKLLASIGKPPGFYDPNNPGELPAERYLPLPEDENDDQQDGDEEQPIGDAEDQRWPMLSFSNTDIAFRDDLMVTGSYHGFNAYRLDDQGIPQHLASVVCPGGQGDVSIVGDLLIMSVEEKRGRVDCGLEGVAEDTSPERFRGIRIFNIANVTQPVQVGAVQTCRGSHTHSVVSSPEVDGKIIVYNSGISKVRDEEELPGCIDELPGDDRTALFRIDVIEIPVADPSQAKIVSSPAVFADADTGNLAGLWRGGDHGDDTQETSATDQCHDITVFPERNLAAGACSGNGILFDITDPLNPRRIDAVVDENFAYWHSATFNNDGTKVLFTDEWGGGSRARCRTFDPLDWGADAIYDIVDGKLEYRSHFKIPAPQDHTENCVAHNGSIIPVPGRDLFVQSWYQGGISVIDFTDSANPIEIAYFDWGPLDAEDLVFGGFWSSYWYNGRIYGTGIVRGIDVLALTPSEFLTANEIEAALLADQGGAFNPQQQYQVTWPIEPVVGLAYVDQLDRTDALPESLRDELSQTLTSAKNPAASQKGFARTLRKLAREVGNLALTGANTNRQNALRDLLTALAKAW